MKELNSFKELFTWNKEEQQDLEFVYLETKIKHLMKNRSMELLKKF